MRVGAYVDAYNLYYGGRHCCGRGSTGWRWLDVRGLVERLVADQVGWAGAVVDRVVYCTLVLTQPRTPQLMRTKTST